MDEHRLPDDLRDWPQDPFAVLGLPPDADDRAVRAAYARLVRVFRPESRPEEFQRLRECYEQARLYASWRRAAQEEPLDDDGSTAAADPSARPATDGDEDPDALADRARLDEDEVDAAWRRACAGDAAGYRRLVELQQAAPLRSDVCRRLWWSLELVPDFDPHRTAWDWLVAGLGCPAPDDVLVAACGRAMQADPEAALGPKFAELLERTASSGAVAPLARIRWRIASRADRLMVVADDVARLRPIVAEPNPTLWAELLLAAIDHAAFVVANDVEAWPDREGWIRELESLEDVAPWIRHDLVRLDVESETLGVALTILKMQELFSADGRDGLSFMANAMRRLSSEADERDGEALRRALVELAARSPEETLAFFERTAGMGHCAGWIAERARRERWFVNRTEPEPDEDDAYRLRRRVRELLADLVALLPEGSSLDDEDLRTLRRAALRFCVDEHLALDEVAAIVAELRIPEHSVEAAVFGHVATDPILTAVAALLLVHRE